MTRRSRHGVLQGAMVLLVIVVVPVALLSALAAHVVAGAAPVVDVLVAASVVAWAAVTCWLARLVALQVRSGQRVSEPGPLGWAAVRLAAFVLCVAPFLDHPPTGRLAPLASPQVATVVASVSGEGRDGGVTELGGGASVEDIDALRHPAHVPNRCRPVPHTPLPLGSGSMLVPLAATARRRRRISRRIVLDDEGAVDVETVLLGVADAPTSLLCGVARALAAAGRLVEPAHVVVADGEATLDDGTWRFDPMAPQRDIRCLLVVLGEERGRTHVVYAPRGATIELDGPGAVTLVDDAVRVGAGLGLGRPVRTGAAALFEALALREDDDVVVCDGPVGDVAGVDASVLARCVHVVLDGTNPLATIGALDVLLADGRVLERAALAPSVRALLDGAHDQPVGATLARRHEGDAHEGDARPGVAHEDHALEDDALEDDALEDGGVIVRLLTAVPRVDGLVAPLEAGRERRCVELVAYLALRDGEPVTGERLRVRVLGTSATDAAAKTLFNVASCLRRALGEGAFGPRLPAAGRSGHYVVAQDVRCDVALLHARVARSRRCVDAEEQMAWLRAGLELIESEPFATVLEGYDWFLAEGHVARLQAVTEDAACELVSLALAHGYVELATFAIEAAALVDRHSERLAAAASQVAAARQASFEAIAPAARKTVPSAPAVV